MKIKLLFDTLPYTEVDSETMLEYWSRVDFSLLPIADRSHCLALTSPKLSREVTVDFGSVLSAAVFLVEFEERKRNLKRSTA